MKVVIPSVQYADMLAVTLPAWRKMLPQATFRVVTNREDLETKRIAKLHGAKVCVTDAWTRRDAVFNKALALDRAFGIAGQDQPPAIGELCLALDADVYPFGVFPVEADLAANVLYGCPRMHCETPQELDDHVKGKTALADLQLMPPLNPGQRSPGAAPYSLGAATASARRCLGYFQLFRYREGLRFGSSKTAGGYDLRFRHHFEQRYPLTSFYVLHLGHRDRANWSGRVVAQWGAA